MPGSEHPPTPPADSQGDAPGDDRRSFLSRAGTVAMTGGLLTSGGSAAFIAGRFLYPAHARRLHRLFVASVADWKAGESRPFRTPLGEEVTIARRTTTGDATDFVALSSVCPHLGCQVHWQAENTRFFCPCHNGVFDAQGIATEGPPADAGQSLSTFALEVEKDLLYISVPIEGAQRNPS